jgi:hypothetical protein
MRFFRAGVIVTRRTRDIEGQPKFGSPVVHVAFEVGEEPVKCGSLPGLLRRRNTGSVIAGQNTGSGKLTNSG